MSIKSQIATAKKKAKKEIDSKRKKKPLVARSVPGVNYVDDIHHHRHAHGEYRRKIIDELKRDIVNKRTKRMPYIIHGETKKKQNKEDPDPAYTDSAVTSESTKVKRIHDLDSWYDNLTPSNIKPVKFIDAFRHYKENASKAGETAMHVGNFGKRLIAHGYSLIRDELGHLRVGGVGIKKAK